MEFFLEVVNGRGQGKGNGRFIMAAWNPVFDIFHPNTISFFPY